MKELISMQKVWYHNYVTASEGTVFLSNNYVTGYFGSTGLTASTLHHTNNNTISDNNNSNNNNNKYLYNFFIDELNGEMNTYEIKLI